MGGSTCGCLADFDATPRQSGWKWEFGGSTDGRCCCGYRVKQVWNLKTITLILAASFCRCSTAAQLVDVCWRMRTRQRRPRSRLSIHVTRSRTSRIVRSWRQVLNVTWSMNQLHAVDSLYEAAAELPNSSAEPPKHRALLLLLKMTLLVAN
ncbi:hypothetical protein MRB53_038043 [Persea americana]|nr:hypothetical protein MRB53_038043 [Persea americana]